MLLFFVMDSHFTAMLGGISVISPIITEAPNQITFQGLLRIVIASYSAQKIDTRMPEGGYANCLTLAFTDSGPPDSLLKSLWHHPQPVSKGLYQLKCRLADRLWLMVKRLEGALVGPR